MPVSEVHAAQQQMQACVCSGAAWTISQDLMGFGLRTWTGTHLQHQLTLAKGSLMWVFASSSCHSTWILAAMSCSLTCCCLAHAARLLSSCFCSSEAYQS